MYKDIYDSFLNLVRLGIGHDSFVQIISDNWVEVYNLANQQGLLAVVLDGIEKLPDDKRPTKEVLLNWIGEVLQSESMNALQREVTSDMSKLYFRNGIRTYILKGAVVSECYPKPNHRVSVDVDCFLLPDKGDFDAWCFGNDLIRTKGFPVKTDFYKNSTFDLSGVIVENHQFLTPFRGNKRLTSLENVLQAYLKRDNGHDVFDGTRMYRPPVSVTSLFLIEHAYSHFLHEGLTWRHVLDWMMFSRKHKNDINWTEFEVFIDEFGFRKFYDSYKRLGQYLVGEIDESDLTKIDKRMMADVWAPLDLHDTLQGIKGKLNEVGSTMRAWWKYHYFSEISMIHDLFIQVKGYLFMKHPKL